MRVRGAVLCLFLAGCGNAVGPDYRGEPVATIRGTLSVRSGVSVPSSVRLAIVWYPPFDANASNPQAITTQDLEYQGTFPADYQFDLMQPPPPEALRPVKTGQGNQAEGLLVAYVDSNGNHTLDTIEYGGPVVDEVLGASDSLFSDRPTSYRIAYFDHDVPWYFSGATVGFNLIQYRQTGFRLTAVPLSTPVPLELTRQRELSGLLCHASYLDFNQVDPNPLAFCGLTSTPGILRTQVAASRESWSVGEPTVEDVSVLVSDGAQWLASTITLNGVEIPDGLAMPRAHRELLRLGQLNTVVVNAPPYSPKTITFMMPEDFQLLSPSPHATVHSPLTIEFSGPAPALVGIKPVGKDGSWVERNAMPGFTTPQLPFSGPTTILFYWLTSGEEDGYGSQIWTSTVGTQSLYIAP